MKKEQTQQEINMTPKSARPIGVKNLTDGSMTTKYADRVRHGKTERDRNKKARKVSE